MTMGLGLTRLDAARPKRQWSVWTDNRHLVSEVMKRYNNQKDYEARCAKRRRLHGSDTTMIEEERT